MNKGRDRASALTKEEIISEDVGEELNDTNS